MILTDLDAVKISRPGIMHGLERKDYMVGNTGRGTWQTRIINSSEIEQIGGIIRTN